jgi:hypothetical protein
MYFDHARLNCEIFVGRFFGDYDQKIMKIFYLQNYVMYTY